MLPFQPKSVFLTKVSTSKSEVLDPFTVKMFGKQPQWGESFGKLCNQNHNHNYMKKCFGVSHKVVASSADQLAGRQLQAPTFIEKYSQLGYPNNLANSHNIKTNEARKLKFSMKLNKYHKKRVKLFWAL